MKKELEQQVKELKQELEELKHPKIKQIPVYEIVNNQPIKKEINKEKMKKELKFDLGDKVFYVGDGNIYQALIGEVRYIKRNLNERGIVNTYEHKIYRLAKDNKYDAFHRNNKVIVPYRGEFDGNYWFDESQIFKTQEEAIKYITDNIIYIKNDEDILINKNEDLNI